MALGTSINDVRSFFGGDILDPAPPTPPFLYRTQGPRRGGQTETALMLCRLNKGMCPSSIKIRQPLFWTDPYLPDLVLTSVYFWLSSLYLLSKNRSYLIKPIKRISNQFNICSSLTQNRQKEYPLMTSDQESRREGWTDARSAVGFCLGSGLFGSYNSD